MDHRRPEGPGGRAGQGRGRAGDRLRRCGGRARGCGAARVEDAARRGLAHLGRTEAVGWIRFVFDREKVPYAYIRDEDVRAGRLRDKYDVIIFGHNYLGLQDQIHGIDKKFGPMAYTKTKETPNLGVPDASADITGGIGWLGMATIEEFLGAGGVLVTLGNGSALALDGGFVSDVCQVRGAFFTPEELKVKFARPDHPLAYGSPEVTSVFRADEPVYDVAGPSRRTSSCSGARSSGPRTAKRRSRTERPS